MQKKLNKINFFQAPNGAIELRQDASSETMWANLNQIAQLFEKDKSVISRHINNIYNTQELDKNSTVAKIATVQNEGKRKVTRKIDYYNLDVILSVGYRVNSIRATHFRIWATQVLKQHITDGFTINQKVLNQNKIQFIKALEDLKILSQTQ